MHNQTKIFQQFGFNDNFSHLKAYNHYKYGFFWTLHETVTPYVAIVFTKLVIYVLKPVCIEFFAQEVWAVCCYAGIPILNFEQVFPLG